MSDSDDMETEDEPAAAPTADEIKNLGNTAFKKGDLREAIAKVNMPELQFEPCIWSCANLMPGGMGGGGR
jgi:hypothetical protein